MSWIFIWMLSAWACLAGVNPVLQNEYTTNTIPLKNNWSIVVYGITNNGIASGYGFGRNLARYNGQYYWSNATLNIPNLGSGGYVNNTTNFFFVRTSGTYATVFAFSSPTAATASVDMGDGYVSLPVTIDKRISYDTNSIVFVDAGGSADLCIVNITLSKSALNTSPLVTSATYSTNQFTVGNSYSTGPYRSILIGSAYLLPSTLGDAGVNILYTNNGVPYILQMQASHSASLNAYYYPFSIPLSPSGGFGIIANNGSGASSYVTNTILWNY